jgi:adenylate cyclase
MSIWNKEQVASIQTHFNDLTSDLPDRLDSITDGRVVPEADDVAIGGARKLRGAVLFFDIRGFTDRTGSPDTESLKQTLYMVNTVIPMVMKHVHDHGGYIEKNTGDGIMAVIGAEAGTTDAQAAEKALEIAMNSFYSLEHIINPHLATRGIAAVQARIGIDLGPLLIARIGAPKGSAAQDRSFLTAVGPAANFACKLQCMAETNEIWVGDLIKRNAPTEWQNLFTEKSHGLNWVYLNTGAHYPAWHFHAARPHPIS